MSAARNGILGWLPFLPFAFGMPQRRQRRPSLTISGLTIGQQGTTMSTGQGSFTLTAGQGGTTMTNKVRQ